jgi:hypothetical protein
MRSYTISPRWSEQGKKALSFKKLITPFSHGAAGGRGNPHPQKNKLHWFNKSS